MVMAYVYANAGQHDAAIDILEQLMAIPSYISAGRLRVDPWFDALRGHPRFEALIAKGDVVVK